MAMDPFDRLITLLNPRQKLYMGQIASAMTVPVTETVDPSSDIATPEFVSAMSDVLRTHHVFSSKHLGKEFFEHALANVLTDAGHETTLNPMGFPGADIVVDGSGWSLKTQADRSLKDDFVHISKFMELGKGAWQTEEDLSGLRDRMLAHLLGYDRIFTMRYLSNGRSHRKNGTHEYELVEIFKDVLAESEHFPCRMNSESSQTPKPGTCIATDSSGVMFELYFDGGTERKLQIRKLRIDLCRVHVRWEFPRSSTPG